MNRRVLESDPHSVLEGMIIAGYAIGAERGYIYCRASIRWRSSTSTSPSSRRANSVSWARISSARASRLIWKSARGAGAFVCGEETALIASIEGRRGEPRPRRSRPSRACGAKPTNNNVESYANIPQIILNGPEWFASMGTERSKGTKTFFGRDVKHTGLIEVPLGITLREIVFDVGGGIKGDKGFKAIQTGGPMGGCLPADLDLPVDYESLTQAGSMMGSATIWWLWMTRPVWSTSPASSWSSPGTKAAVSASPAGLAPAASSKSSPTSARARASRVTSSAGRAEQQHPRHGAVRFGTGRAHPVLSTLQYFREGTRRTSTRSAARPRPAAR